MNADKPLSRKQLENRIEELYGAETRFYTCSVEGMTLEHLIDFLERRGKITVDNDLIRAHRDKMCSH